MPAALRRLLGGLAGIPGVGTVGPNHPDTTIGVVPFTVDGFDHGLVAAILGYVHGIAVRSGCFYAHPYVAHLLGLRRGVAYSVLCDAPHRATSPARTATTSTATTTPLGATRRWFRQR